MSIRYPIVTNMIVKKKKKKNVNAREKTIPPTRNISNVAASEL